MQSPFSEMANPVRSISYDIRKIADVIFRKKKPSSVAFSPSYSNEQWMELPALPRIYGRIGGLIEEPVI